MLQVQWSQWSTNLSKIHTDLELSKKGDSVEVKSCKNDRLQRHGDPNQRRPYDKHQTKLELFHIDTILASTARVVRSLASIFIMTARIHTICVNGWSGWGEDVRSSRWKRGSHCINGCGGCDSGAVVGKGGVVRGRSGAEDRKVVCVDGVVGEVAAVKAEDAKLWTVSFEGSPKKQSYALFGTTIA